jgi:hypothetical protein
MRVNGPGALAVAGMLVAVALPVWAQDSGSEGSPAPSPEVTQIPTVSESGRPDLYLDMPYYLGSFEPDIVMTRGEEHFANLAADDSTRLELEGLLETVGAEIEDMVSGYALVSQEDFFSFVVAIRIEGVEPGTLLPAYLPILFEDLEDPQGIVAQKGGKDVVLVASIGNEGEYVELYVYDQGDTVWMLQGPNDVVERALENLPGPLPAA